MTTVMTAFGAPDNGRGNAAVRAFPFVPRFGVFLPQGVTNELAHLPPRDHAQVIRAFAERAEADRFDSLWVSDHFHHIRDGDQGGNHEAWTLLSAASQWTNHVELGQLVMCVAFRNPALLAKMAASLDVLSEGRLVLGLGAGWHQPEFVGYGYPFPAPKERLARLHEAIEIIRPMLDGKRPTCEGEYFSTAEAECDPGPLQSHLPILIGGRGQVTLRIAAQHADRMNVSGTTDDFAAALARLGQSCDRVGRDAATIEKSWMTLGVLVRETESEVRAARDALAGVRRIRLQIAGTPQQVAEELQAFIDLGCQHLILTFSEAPRLEPLDLFSSAVRPLLSA
jgi:alkanesulfonate monooxygenase SsuD/methylene tetrahydromethanopterin reductase-like flavin-dependent oxidoreductase (luciferase family)